MYTLTRQVANRSLLLDISVALRWYLYVTHCEHLQGNMSKTELGFLFCFVLIEPSNVVP